MVLTVSPTSKNLVVRGTCLISFQDPLREEPLTINTMDFIEYRDTPVEFVLPPASTK